MHMVIYRSRRIVRLIGIGTVFSTFCLVLILFSSFHDNSSDYSNSNVVWFWSEKLFTSEITLWDRPVISVQNSDNKSIDHNSSFILQPLNEIPILRDYIHKINVRQFISNEDLYGSLSSSNNLDPLLSPNFVFVIQVHNRSLELSILIESLRRVKGIESALLVFSHDFYSDEINQLIKAIRFTRTVQIFFPHSTQVFQNTFPGSHPQDCPSRMPVMEAKQRKCFNADWHDTHSHYRESKFAQIKHHWIWKMVFVFNHLYATTFFEKHIIFLEEDYFVVEDILHVLEMLESGLWKLIDVKGLITFGSYDNDQNYINNHVEITSWKSSLHNMGLGISRALWKKISQCLNQFCTYDDYNWDWTLQYLNQKCIPGGLNTITFPHATRIYHLGNCRGIHHNKINCSPKLLATHLVQKLSGISLSKLYPNNFTINSKYLKLTNLPVINGGWGDHRDHNLCLSITESKWREILLIHCPELTNYSSVY